METRPRSCPCETIISQRKKKVKTEAPLLFSRCDKISSKGESPNKPRGRRRSRKKAAAAAAAESRPPAAGGAADKRRLGGAPRGRVAPKTSRRNGEPQSGRERPTEARGSASGEALRRAVFLASATAAAALSASQKPSGGDSRRRRRRRRPRARPQAGAAINGERPSASIPRSGQRAEAPTYLFIPATVRAGKSARIVGRRPALTSRLRPLQRSAMAAAARASRRAARLRGGRKSKIGGVSLRNLRLCTSGARREPLAACVACGAVFAVLYLIQGHYSVKNANG